MRATRTTPPTCARAAAALLAALTTAACAAPAAAPAGGPPTSATVPAPAGDPLTVEVPALTAATAAPEVLGAEVPRDTAPDVPADDLAALVAGNTAFGLDLYRLLAGSGDGNLLVAPHSVSSGLALVYAGARGDTAAEMARTLHFDLPPERLHPAFGALDRALAGRARPGEVELAVANRAWGQEGYAFLDDYVATLARDHDAPLGLLDFVGDPEGSRRAVNDWVAGRTRDRIPELFPAGTIDGMTRLVLANAVFLDARWHLPFNPDLTVDESFLLADGTTAPVPTMHFNEYLPSGAGDGWQAVELPYAGEELSMVVVVPDDLPAFEARLDPALLGEVLGGIADGGIHLALPRFAFSSHASLVDPLATLGMPSAFDDADFSGMTGGRDLVVAAIEHAAFVEVDEAGTEAAAATGTAMEESHGPTVTVDRPFLFLVRDRVTGTVLFLGRVVDPRGQPPA